ncbi:copper transporter [Mycobacterium sp.]|uniref:copper transporter n=1 Tax=Mycobacterium sp. TaxID=1785 RepID=UPI002BC62BC0|nr:copper transporter [Mycobacterium sp.]HME46840.1 copper transporter [Mycobacterium sp.]
MISLRQHAFSLAAVFLALAVGVVLGSGLLSDTLLSGLRDDKRQLQNQINTLDQQKNALGEKLNSAGDFDAAMAGRMLHDSLAEKSVVIFRTPDSSDDVVQELTRLVGEAGGTVTGTVALTEQFVDANNAEKLLSVVNSSILPAGSQLSTASVDQGSQAGDLMGIVLQINKNPAAPPVDDAQRNTALAALRETGFITYPDKPISAANAALVVTGGGLGEDAGNRGSSVARFAAALAPHGSGTVLAGSEGGASGAAAVAVTRADPGMATAVSTVDDLDMESGRITAILALHDLLNGGHSAHYGTGQGATAVTVPQ